MQLGQVVAVATAEVELGVVLVLGPVKGVLRGEVGLLQVVACRRVEVEPGWGQLLPWRNPGNDSRGR